MAIAYHVGVMICKRALSDYAAVAPGGYAWWYFDAVSDDGRYACACIFLVGSVFSPDYAARIRRGERARAEEHLGVNLAVYERDRPCLWVMSEHGEGALGGVGGGGLRIAGNGIERSSDGKLTIAIDDETAPFLVALAGRGRRVAGTIELEPLGPSLPPVPLLPGGGASDGSGGEGERHVWHVVAPRARFRLRLERPRLAFEGIGYHDINAGNARLERAFASWSWARCHDRNRTVIGYAVRARGGATGGFIAEASDRAVGCREAGLSDGAARRAGWGLSIPSQFTLTAGDGARLVCTPTRIWDVAPFYARYAATFDEGRDGVGGAIDGMGEHLDLGRFDRRGIQFLLRFKTRRARR
jgi:carotenoid 1,2-hydratase